MATKRLFSPRFFSGASNGRLTREGRLAYAAIICESDDLGIMPAKPHELKALAFAYDDDIDIKRCEEIAAELEAKNKIVRLKDKGVEYWWGPTILEEQPGLSKITVKWPVVVPDEMIDKYLSEDEAFRYRKARAEKTRTNRGQSRKVADTPVQSGDVAEIAGRKAESGKRKADLSPQPPPAEGEGGELKPTLSRVPQSIRDDAEATLGILGSKDQNLLIHGYCARKFPDAWWPPAFEKTRLNGGRRMAYVMEILEDYEKQGGPPSPKPTSGGRGVQPVVETPQPAYHKPLRRVSEG